LHEAFPDLTPADPRYWPLYVQMQEMVDHPFVLEPAPGKISDLQKIVRKGIREEQVKELKDEQMIDRFLDQHPEFRGTPRD
jgi:hypothetical protein